LPRLADVVTKTFRSISPEALSERLFRDPLARWWQTYHQKLQTSGYEGGVQGAFFISSFAAMGHIAKCDGRVKAVEIELATQVMDHLKLSAEQKQLAIRLFNEGKHEDFALETLLWRFKRECGHRVSVVQVFIEIQLKMAYADASLNEKESKIIKLMCKRLDVSTSIYARIERRVRAEKKAAKQPVASAPNKIFSLADACEMLGVNRWANQAQVKQAYRRMVGKFHPDKMLARGASEVDVIEAHDILHDIKNAYHMLLKAKRVR
jgi:DnaJ like chaperone protein